ncbi:hypothetical protein [Treponema sp.]|uniref:hypothetical protein n=1 Tax=Treponema sp. TaxID=166 RepID=UPI00298E71B4|nr:hypothetical protein [Treponema sp.]MCQ2242035.1 hypothetical protein [Treponema sp.]
MMPDPMQMMNQMFGQSGQLPQFDEIKFRQFLPKLNDQNLNQIIQQARMMGIPDRQIEEGMRIIKSFK